MIKKLIYLSLVGFILLVASLAFLLNTTPGLYLSVKLISHFLPGQLVIEKPAGTLLKQVHFKTLAYRDSEFEVIIKEGSIDWQLPGLWHRHLTVERIEAARLEWKSRSSRTRTHPSDQTIKLSSQSFPISVQLKTLIIHQLILNQQPVFKDLELGADFDQTKLLIDHCSLQWHSSQLKGTIQLDLAPLPIIHASFKAKGLNPLWEAKARLEGDLNHLNMSAAILKPWPLTLTGQLVNLEQLSLKGQWQDLHWLLDSKTLHSPQGSFEVDGRLNALNATLHAELSQPIKANLELNSELSHNILTAKGRISLEQGVFESEAHYDPGKAFQMNFTSKELDLSPLTPGLRLHQLKGQLQGTKLTDLKGNLALEADYLANRLGLTLDWNQGNNNPGHLSLKTSPSHWQIKGPLLLNEQPIELQGEGLFKPAVSGKLKIKALGLKLIQSQEYELTASPDLELGFSSDHYHLQGQILIPSAKIQPEGFDESLGLNEDVVFIENKKNTKASTGPSLSAKIDLKMGEDVQLKVKGLQGYLDGSLSIQKAAQSPATADGELRIRDGRYQMYGQTLQITSGKMIFSGGVLTNPGLAITAIKEFNTVEPQFTSGANLVNFSANNLSNARNVGKTTVGLRINGRLANPRITLFSNPANLSQADILALIILGRPVSQANQAGGQLLLTALSSLNLDKGAKGQQMLGQIKQHLGLDISMSNTANFNPQTGQISESRALVVSKSLSKRLQISYNVALAQGATNVLILKYLLNQFFSIQITASTVSNGVDLMYTREKP